MNDKQGTMKIPVDEELRAAINAARQRHRTTRTGYVRTVLLDALRREGHLSTTTGGDR